METDELEEVKTVFTALFDTLTQCLRPDIIIDRNSWLREHQAEFLEDTSSEEDKSEALFQWILDYDEDRAIAAFLSTLKELTSSQGDVHLIVRNDKQDKTHWIKYFASLLDGSLVKELSVSEAHSLLDTMLDSKMITKQVHKQAKEVGNPHKCCQIMYEGIIKSRGKSNWPFVFLDALSKVKPDLVQQKIESTEQSNQAVSDLAEPKIASVSNRTKNTETDVGSNIGEILHCLDNMSELTDNFFNEDVEAPVVMTDREFKSEFIAAWVNSENISGVSYSNCHSLHAWILDEDLCVKQPEAPTIQLREYQKELAKAGLNGINTIICAPTGCGKTLVAVHIILSHLQAQQDETRPRKVVFCARTVPLVMQQYRVLQEFLFPKYQVISLTGDNKKSLHLETVIPEVDVLVMTPQVLRNNLIWNGEEHLDKLSLLVFDECHHTRKEEPYNMLMRYYLKRKQKLLDATSRGEQTEIKLPQILGLTASIGVDNASSDDQAKENILQICGNLDVEYISSVEENVQELAEQVHLSKEELLPLSERGQDGAVLRIVLKMKQLENNMMMFAKTLNNKELEDLLKSIPLERKSISYGNWAVKVKNIARSIPRSEVGKFNNYKRLLIILGEYLTTYNVALELHNLVLLRHVMEYLERCFRQYQDNKNCTEEEKSYFESFSDLQDTMRDQLDKENPNLDLLKMCLMKYIVRKDEGARGIIFVRTRALVRALTSWLNSCDGIDHLNAAPFTGTSASAAQGGMTVAQQEEIILLFRRGQVRLLVATSVAEEGIDIPECNLVIKYNYTGNEITTVQTRGRSRKKGGVSVILAMPKIIEKERENQRKAEMMERAVKLIRQMDPSEIHKKIIAHQQKSLQDLQASELRKRQLNMTKKREHFKMVCHGCSVVVIDSRDIKIVSQTHYAVVNWNIMKQTRTVAGDAIKSYDDFKLIGEVKCRGKLEGGKDCNSKLGSLMIFSNIPFVVLGIKRFGFETANNRNLSNYKNWKNVPYAVDELAAEDLDRYYTQMTAAASINNYSNNRPSVASQGFQYKEPVQEDETPAQKKFMAENVQTYQNNAQEHANLSHQTVSMAVVGQMSATNSGAGLLTGWTALESKFSSLRTLVQEKLPSLQISEGSTSDGDSLSTVNSVSDHDTISDARPENLNQHGSNSEGTSMDITNAPSLVTERVNEQTETKNNSSPEDVLAQTEHMAEVGDTFYS